MLKILIFCDKEPFLKHKEARLDYFRNFETVFETLSNSGFWFIHDDLKTVLKSEKIT